MVRQQLLATRSLHGRRRNWRAPRKQGKCTTFTMQSSDDSESAFKLHKLGRHSSDPGMVTLSLNGKDLEMEVDAGTAFSVISEATRQAIFPSETLCPSDLMLKTYTNERMEVKGPSTCGCGTVVRRRSSCWWWQVMDRACSEGIGSSMFALIGATFSRCR